MKIVIMR